MRPLPISGSQIIAIYLHFKRPTCVMRFRPSRRERWNLTEAMMESPRQLRDESDPGTQPSHLAFSPRPAPGICHGIWQVLVMVSIKNWL